MMEANHSRENAWFMPVYNIKAVARLVGLLPVTLRAWERRYGLPSPQRGQQGYRLYSDYDLSTLRWLKEQTEAGMSIGRAADYLAELRAQGRDPALESGPRLLEQPVSLPVLSAELYHALTRLNDAESNEILRRAFNLYAVDQVLQGVVTPALVELGDAWHRGELPIAVEHFATQFCMQHMMGMISASAPPSRSGVIVAAGAPGEFHQIGLLMLVVMLRWRGWDVRFLGADLSLDRLEEALAQIHPRMLLFSATRPEAAENLAGLPFVLEKLPAPRPLVVLGGQAFEHVSPVIPAEVIRLSPSESVERIEKLIYESLAANPGGMNER